MKIVKSIWLSLGIALSALAPMAHATNIVFDFGDVLIETKYVQTIFSIGIEKFAYFASTWHNPFGCHKKLFEFLGTLQPAIPGDIIVKDAHGHIVPPLMVDWLKGELSGAELLEIIRHSKGTFINWSEEALVRSLAEMVFNPKTFVKTRQLIQDGVRFAKEYKQAGYKLYILSNWDPESFTLLEMMYPDFFSLFDGIMISGDVHLAKPDPAIFYKLRDTFNLDLADTVFIDDQIENVTAAENAGMHSILYTKKKGLFKSYHDFDRIRHKITEWLLSKDFAPSINQ